MVPMSDWANSRLVHSVSDYDAANRTFVEKTSLSVKIYTNKINCL